MTPYFYSATPWNVPSGGSKHYTPFVRALMNALPGPDRQLPGLERGEHLDVLDRHPAPDGRADEGDARRPATWWTRKAKIIAPPLVTRLQYELDWIKRYETQKFNGKPVWRFYDVVALSLYPLARYGGRAGVPEDSIRLLNAAKKELRRSGVPSTKPIWDTEINYGLQSGSGAVRPAAPVSASKQAANVVRTYLLQAANKRQADRLVPLRLGPDLRWRHARQHPAHRPRRRHDGDRRRSRLRHGAEVDARHAAGQTRPATLRQGLHTAPTLRGHRLLRHQADLLEPVPPGQGPAGQRCPPQAGRARGDHHVKGGSTLTVDFRPVLVYR